MESGCALVRRISVDHKSVRPGIGAVHTIIIDRMTGLQVGIDHVFPCCVATAMAQVLSVYRYPDRCSGGTFSYHQDDAGIDVSLDFDEVTLNWDAMTSGRNRSCFPMKSDQTTRVASGAAKVNSRNSAHWGWGGMSNGYFTLTALDPASQGIGGSSSGYNFSQNIITSDSDEGTVTSYDDTP